MSALGPKKKNQLFIMLGVIAGAVIISLVLDIMTNNGGRVILVGAIAGIIIAAVLFLVFNMLDKKNAGEEEVSDENRFTRKKNKDKNTDLFDAAGFNDEPAADGFNGFDRFDDEFVIEPQAEETDRKSQFAPPSQQLREKGFFGRKTAEEPSLEPETIENEEPVWSEPEYDDSFEPQFEGFENDEFAGEEFEAPVIAFGDPVPAEEAFAEETYSEEQFSEQFEESVSFEEEIRPEISFDSEFAEPQFEEAQYEEPIQETTAETEIIPEPIPEPEAIQSEPQNNLLLKDVAPGMVIASQAPGQTLESFYADMSEEDIIYRDCVEVWSSAAKNPMMKILEKLKNIEDKKVAGELGRDCEYVNAMIDRMLYFTQLEMIDQALNMQVYNYSVLVKECLKRFSPFFTEKKISLLWKGLDVNVITDKRWFIFAMTQIIFNSIEFTPHGGKIAVSAKKTDDYVDLIIDDSGEGVDEEELPYVFTAGFMGDEAPNPDDTRTGMGLFITRTVLQKLGGEVMAESSKGKGMRIVIRLPAMKEETEN